MAKINSKNKGNRFDRAMCKFFTESTGNEFSRVPAYGGLRWKKTDNLTSDITCTDPKHSKKFPLSIECKSYSDLKFEHILLGVKSCKILAFWEQAKSDAERGNKIPILIMKYNNMPRGEAFVMVDNRLIDLVLSDSGKFKKPTMVINTKEEKLGIFMLSDISTIDYNLFYKKIKNRNKKNQ